MTAEREKELFDKYLNSRYSQLIQKAHTNAVWELNGRKMPKKTRVMKLKEDGRFPALVEKYKKECDTLHIIELRNGDMRSEFVEKIKNSPDFKEFCIKHENEEERDERKRMEEEREKQEQKEREKFINYLETKEFKEIVARAMETIRKKLIEKASNYFRTIDVLEYEHRDFYLAHRGIYNRYNSEHYETEDVDEYLESIFDIYEDKIKDELLENICGIEWYNCGVTAEIRSKLPKWVKTLQYDYNDDLVEYSTDNDYDTDTFCDVRSYFTREEVLELLSENPYIHKIFLKKEKEEQKKRETEQIILEHIPERYVDLFPMARKMKRHFVLHVGPTNSGKTHDAMKKLRTGSSGVYLAPLRLLAYEQFEGLNKDGVPCTLLTGEEKIEVPNAQFIASTIEMANYHTKYDFAVIDEAQMIADPSRGGSWTFAILGIQADEIHVCMSADAEKLIIRLVEECGDTYEVVRHERKTPLVCETTEFSYLNEAKKGDALIVFSRRNVHAVASELTKKGHKCSVIYGALPYSVRHEQAELFASGKTDIVVATDAIGMGMNLPIRRVIFLEQSKYDGTNNRPLLPSEYKQIAGRAGRFGIYDTGYVTSLGDRKRLMQGLNTKDKDQELAVIAFPEILLGIDEKLSAIIERWIEMDVQEGYKKAVAERELILCQEMEEYTDNKRFIYRFITIPFNEKEYTLYHMWQSMYKCELKGEAYPIGESIPPVTDELENMELNYRVCDLLYAYASRFGYPEHIEDIQNRKTELSKKIASELSKKKLTERRCKHCGKVMRWNYPYSMCNNCHDILYPKYYRNDNDYYDDDDFISWY